VPDDEAVPMAMGVERLHSPEARKRAVVTSHQGESLTWSVATRRYAVALGSSISQVTAILAVAVAVEGLAQLAAADLLRFF